MNNNTLKKYKAAKGWLLFWTLFIGVGAVFGSTCMFIGPSGSALQMEQMLPYMQVLPFGKILFKDFIFSGFALLIVNGLSNLTAAVLMLFKKQVGMILGTIFGITLMLWICIQFAIFPTNPLDISYFIFGFLQFITGYCGCVSWRQMKFEASLNEATYDKIGLNKSELVVYFSRTGHTKKLAYERANQTGAKLYEITAKEHVSGTSGFWWCGRFGMHGWPMQIENEPIDFSKYEYVTLCSPVWVFTLCGPMRQFCKTNAGKFSKYDVIIDHFNTAQYKNVFCEIEKLLGAPAQKKTSVAQHMEKVVNVYEIC